MRLPVKILYLILSLAYLYLGVFGTIHFHFATNAVYFTLTSLFATCLLIYSSGYKATTRAFVFNKNLAQFIAIIIIACAGILLYNYCLPVFKANPDTGKISDVIPQLAFQAKQFVEHKNPYVWIPLGGYTAFPAYLPAQWAPFCIAVWLKMDLRILALLLAVISSVMVWYAGRNKTINLSYFLLPLSPMIGIYLFANIAQNPILNDTSLAYTLEPLIAAYYFILLCGLLFNNTWLIAIGLLTCILSRYTLVFWLPLLAISYFYPKINFRNIKVPLFVLLTGILCFYFIPYYLTNNTIFALGMQHYQQAIEGEWSGGHGEPPIPFSFFSGNYLAYFFHQLPGTDLLHKISINRTVQLSSIALANCLLVIWYLKKCAKAQPGLFLAASLVLIVKLFYLLSPLTYKYYFISVFTMDIALLFYSLGIYNASNKLK